MLEVKRGTNHQLPTTTSTSTSSTITTTTGMSEKQHEHQHPLGDEEDDADKLFSSPSGSSGRSSIHQTPPQQQQQQQHRRRQQQQQQIGKGSSDLRQQKQQSLSSKNSSSSSRHRLFIHKQPSHVFEGETFVIEFSLDPVPGESPPANVEIRVRLLESSSSSSTADMDSSPGSSSSRNKKLKSDAVAAAAAATTTTSSSSARLDILQEPRLSNTRLTGSVSCRLVSVSPTTATTTSIVGQSYTLLLEANHAGVQSVATKPITIVQGKLSVETADDWSNVWFKDEGGREKSMEVTVTAVSSSSGSSSSTSGSPSQQQQELLLEQPAVVPMILKDNIYLNAKLCYDSKMPVSNQGIFRLLGRTLVINKATGQCKVRYRVEDVSKNHQGQSFVLELTAKERPDIAPAYTPPVTIRSKRNKRLRSQSAMTSTMATGTTTTSSSFGPLGSSTSSSSAAAAAFRGITEDPTRVREALSGVLRWSEEVVSGIYPLQWQVMGYAQNPDGSFDYNRPYHNMQNPNEFIHRILGMYHESTREQLQILRQVVDTGTLLYESQQLQQQQQQQQQLPYGPPLPPHMMPPFFAPAMSSPSFLQQQQQQQQQQPPSLPPPLHSVLKGESIQQQFPFHYAQQIGSESPPQQQPYYPSTITATVGGGGIGRRPRPSLSQSRAKLAAAAAAKTTLPDDESAVEYILAKQFKAFSTGEPLGFPAYSADKQILGFYHENMTSTAAAAAGVGGGGGGIMRRQFVPIRQHAAYFGPAELRQATTILEDAMLEKSKAVHCLKDWGGNLSNLLDHATVYEWSKDIQPSEEDTAVGAGSGVVNSSSSGSSNIINMNNNNKSGEL